jgi:hypothetical protein
LYIYFFLTVKTPKLLRIIYRSSKRIALELFRFALTRIKKVPNASGFWRLHRVAIAGLLALLILLPLVNYKWHTPFTAQAMLKALEPLAGLLVLYILLQRIRQLLEKRPTHFERRQEIEELARMSFHKSPLDANCKRVKIRRVKTQRVIRVANTEELVAQMTLLNCKGFARSVYGTRFENKYRRNLDHVGKNAHVIRLLGMMETGKRALRALSEEEKETIEEEDRIPWIGFSHIIPINETTYHRYLCYQPSDRGIEDIGFPAEHVCAPCETPYAFLVFTVAMDPKLILRWELGQRDRFAAVLNDSRSPMYHVLKTERELYLMVLEHIRELAILHGCTDKKCLLLAQAFKPSTEKMLQALGFTRVDDARTADSEAVYQMKVLFKQE